MQTLQIHLREGNRHVCLFQEARLLLHRVYLQVRTESGRGRQLMSGGLGGGVGVVGSCGVVDG